MKKRILSLLLTLCVALSLLSATALAAEADASTLPNAVFEELVPLTLKSGEYNVWKGSPSAGTTDRPLQIVANFKTNDIYATRAEAKAHPYSQYLVDFYLTVSGLAGGSITADNCYLAGNYGTYGWIVIPTDGTTIETGKEYPVVSVYDATLKYEDICVNVKNFTAAIYIDEVILEANPDMKVTLALKMTNPDDAGDVYTVDTHTWSVADLLKGSELAGMSAEDKEYILGLTETEQEFVLGLSAEDQESFLALDDESKEIVLNFAALDADLGKYALDIAKKLNQGSALAAANAEAVANVEEVETLDVTLADVVVEEGSDVPTLVYEVNPTDENGDKVSNPSSAITFRLPVPDEIGNEYDYAEVIHESESMGIYKIQGEAGGYYVEITSSNFSKFTLLFTNEASEEEIVYFAQIGEEKYETLSAAIAAADDGETVTLLTDIDIANVENAALSDGTNTLFCVADKTITIDLNGKTISGEYAGSELLAGVFSTENGGNLTLTGNGTVDVTATGKVYALLVNYDETSSLTIQNGTYKLDKASSALIYSDGSQCVTVEGGAFTLGNVGTGSNGSPWIINVSGKNQGHATVTGGTFNADIQHQYWVFEVQLPKEKALAHDAENGTWTVVDAVAWVNEYQYDEYYNNVGYATLAEAVAAADDDETVTLLSDLDLTEANCVANADRKVLLDVVGKDITLNMNGKKISVVHEDTFANDYLVAVIRVADGAGLTVTGNGTIDVKANAGDPDIAYMFWKRGTTGHLTIKNGTFRMNDSADSMVYTNGNEIVHIEGGTWTMDAYGTRGNAEPWIFNVQGAGDNHVLVTGGTFNADINRQYWSNEVVVPETCYTVANDDETWTVHSGAVAYVNEGMLTGPYFIRKNIGYATLADAVEAADDGETITLLQDINLTENQYVRKKVTVDLNGKTLSSTGVRTLVAYGANAELTVKNGTVSSDTSGTLTATYNGKLILGDDLTVISTGNFGVYVNRGKIEVPAGTENLFVTGKTKAVGVKAHDDNVFDIKGGMYSTNPGYVADGYGVVTTTVNEKTWYKVIAPVAYVNEDGENCSAAKLQEAIDNAADGSTITLNTDFYLYASKEGHLTKIGDYNAFFVVDNGKTLTIDLNGHNLLGYTRSAPTMILGMFATNNNSHLTLRDSVGDALVRITAQNANNYALITNYSEDSSITIEGGNYELDKASDCLIYSAASANEGEGNTGIVVKGGTFKLGNVGTGANYGPWIFNARGQNQRHNWITGGSFNADIQHQYWIFEAQMPETLALKYDAETGMYTVTDAVCYVAETHGKYVKPVGFASIEDAMEVEEYRQYTYYKTGENTIYNLDGTEYTAAQ